MGWTTNTWGLYPHEGSVENEPMSSMLMFTSPTPAAITSPFPTSNLIGWVKNMVGLIPACMCSLWRSTPINYMLQSVSCWTRRNTSTPQDTALRTHEGLAIQTEENSWQHKLVAGKKVKALYMYQALFPCQRRETGRQRNAEELR